jgi:hypothetical protein
MKNFATLAFGLTVIFAAQASAQEISSGQTYRPLREALLQQGWKPNTEYGLKRFDGGAPLYRFPEVLCGPQICRAKWRDKSGKERAIMLKRPAATEDFTVTSEQ